MMNSENSEKRILACDIGSKRIGLAIWNPAARLARPLEIRHRKTLKEDLLFFKEVIEKEDIEVLLIGIPLSLGGKITSSTENSLFWLEKMKKTFQLPIFTHDESLSTRDANKLLQNTKRSKRKEKRDSIAAALILEEYLGVKN